MRSLPFGKLVPDQREWGDRLYFKVDDLNRPSYQALGMPCFKPYESGQEMRSYYRVPDEVLEDDLLLRQWALEAIAAGRRARKR